MDGSKMHGNCVFAGDSAGGGLCLLLLQRVNEDETLHLPCCAWTISPWTKMTGFGKRDNTKIDAMLYDASMDVIVNACVGNMDVESGKLVKRQGDDGYCNPDDAIYCPFNGEVKGLCPIYMTVGATEMLLDD